MSIQIDRELKIALTAILLTIYLMANITVKYCPDTDTKCYANAWASTMLLALFGIWVIGGGQ